MTTRAYYNENDSFAAQWLRNLILEGLIAPGHVDDRSIEEVRTDDLRGFTQCHFFAGLGGWSCALRLAGWPDDCPIWTGSCPCQPFSRAGKQQGASDERHLWPAFYRLIAECAPAVVFGEQIDGPLGREWISGIRLDLEAAGYAVGIAGLCAAGVQASHNRPRLYWVADADRERWYPRHDEGARMGHRSSVEPGRHRSFWDGFETHEGDDGSLRRSGSGIFPLAAGVSARVGKLRAAGNAIVPQVAAEFIRAAMEAQR
jgi:DNA (cytosine-5)-methyltransferase 1